ncbi:MAG: peptidase domain protein, partial [Gemmatimonadetes bacterium]|nr:peptidase domain protein [Gemmatimonadota bacterium]
AAAGAQAGRAAAPGAAITIPYTTHTLPNGLTVLLSEDHSTPNVAVTVTYHVGSKNEKPGRTGFAHLFEHMMFTGSGHVPYGTHDKYTEGVGGENNGTTNNDRTFYYDVVPSNYLQTELWLESDRMGWLLDALDIGKLNAQRDIVKNERRQRVDNQPYGRVGEITSAALYPSGHPYSWPVIGSMADLSAASVDDVKDFFRLYYAPNNAVLSIAGDIQPQQALAWATRYFGEIHRGAGIQRPTVAPVALAAEKRMTYEDRVQVPRLYMTWPTVGENSDDRYALEVLGSILSGPRTARLTKALVYDRQSAAGVGAFQSSDENVGQFTLFITPRPGHTLTELELAADSVVQRLKAEGPTAEEVARAKAGAEVDFLEGLESNLGKAAVLADGLIYHNDPGYFRTSYRMSQAVTAADVKRVANRYLTGGRLVLSVVPVGKADQASKPGQSTPVPTSTNAGPTNGGSN